MLSPCSTALRWALAALAILTFMGKDGRKKSWWSVGGDGTPYIADGRYPEAGEPPWFTRCR